jgi:hypothetical protein
MDLDKYAEELKGNLEEWRKRFDDAQTILRKGQEMVAEAQRTLDTLNGAMQLLERLKSEGENTHSDIPGPNAKRSHNGAPTTITSVAEKVGIKA